jgi:hypothetical protein
MTLFTIDATITTGSDVSSLRSSHIIILRFIGAFPYRSFDSEPIVAMSSVHNVAMHNPKQIVLSGLRANIPKAFARDHTKLSFFVSFVIYLPCKFPVAAGGDAAVFCAGAVATLTGEGRAVVDMGFAIKNLRFLLRLALIINYLKVLHNTFFFNAGAK